MILAWSLLLSLGSYGDTVFIFGKDYDIETTKEFVPPLHVMSEWPEELFLLRHLEKIEIHSKFITTIPDAITKFSNLKSLDIWGGEIDFVSPNIGDLRNLVELRLNLTNLDRLPLEFANLTRLKELHLCGEHTQFPGSLIGHHKNPEIIYLWSLIKRIGLSSLFLNSRQIAVRNFRAFFEGGPLSIK